jgi:hypothetical protein
MAAEERKQILEMLASGKVSVDEAAKLLEAVEGPGAPGAAGEVPATGFGKGRTLRVRVVENGRQKVNINVPFGLAKLFLGFAGKVLKEEKIKDLDVNEIIRQVERGVSGKIVEVTDDDTLIEVYVE